MIKFWRVLIHVYRDCCFGIGGWRTHGTLNKFLDECVERIIIPAEKQARNVQFSKMCGFLWLEKTNIWVSSDFQGLQRIEAHRSAIIFSNYEWCVGYDLWYQSHGSMFNRLLPRRRSQGSSWIADLLSKGWSGRGFSWWKNNLKLVSCDRRVVAAIYARWCIAGVVKWHLQYQCTLTLFDE